MDRNEIQDTLQSIARDAIAEARKLDVAQAEAGVSYDEGLTVTVRLGELESVERQRDRGLAVTVYRDGRKGSASTADFSIRSIKETVAKAVSIARFTAQDPYAGLADPELMASDPPDLDLYHPWDVDVETASDIALRSEEAARAYDSRISNSEGASVSSSAGVRVYANTHGFCDGYATSSHSLSCTVLAKNGTSQERDYWYSVARSADALEAAEAVGERAAQRALDRLGAKQLATRKAPVLFPADLARGLFGHMLGAIRGASQYRKSSFLLNALGEQIFPETIHIDEDPLIPRGLASAPFDAEGVVTTPRKLVEAGVLQGYLLSSYSARRLGMKTTGNAGGAHNVIVHPTTQALEELINGCQELFVVRELLGQGVNPVTGDYSRGAAGLWIRNGEIAHPVSEVTLAGNLREVYQGIRAVGTDVDLRGTVRCGSVLVEGFTIAGE